MNLRRKLLIASNNTANFYGHGHCSSGDIMNLVCLMTLQDNVAKGSCGFTEKNSSLRLKISQKEDGFKNKLRLRLYHKHDIF